jgi:ComF family protein
MLPWRAWGRGCVELIFPARCCFCRVSLIPRGEVVCPECLALIHYLHSPLCSCCGRELPDSSGGDHLCGSCLRKPPVYAWARAVVSYASPVSHLLHRLKYASDTRALPALIQVLAPFSEVLRQEFQRETDRVVPVPLFSTRLKKRGLNQSLLLARIFFPQAGDTLLADVLIRTRNTPPQTTLDGVARRKNLRAAFAVSNPLAIRGRRIFLVDDVLTTGTTVTECARALLTAGAREIWVVTVARVADSRE